MSDADMDLDERDRELGAVVRVALRARADAIDPEERACPSASSRQPSGMLLVAAAVVVLLVAAVVAVRVADDGGSDSLRTTATGEDVYLLPSWLPDGFVLRSAVGSTTRLGVATWLRVYRTGFEPGAPLIMVRTQQGSRGAPVETVIAGRPANLSATQFGGLNAFVGLDCGLTQVQAENLDRSLALAAMETLRCAPTRDLSAGALALSADYKVVYDGPESDVFPLQRWSLYYESSHDAGVTISFGTGIDPSQRWLFIHPLTTAATVTVRDHPATIVSFGSSADRNLSWRESKGFVELNAGGLDSATLIRIADSLRPVSASDFRAETHIVDGPTPPWAAATPTSPGTTVGATSLPGPILGPPGQIVVTSGREGNVDWTYTTQGPNDCFTVSAPTEKTTSCGLHSGDGVTLPRLYASVSGRQYLLAFGQTTTTRITLALPDGTSYELQPVAKAPDNSAVFFGVIPAVTDPRIVATATLYDSTGTNRTQPMILSVAPIPTPNSTSTTR